MLCGLVWNQVICYVVKVGTRLYVTWLSLEPDYMLLGQVRKQTICYLVKFNDRHQKCQVTSNNDITHIQRKPYQGNDTCRTWQTGHIT